MPLHPNIAARPERVFWLLTSCVITLATMSIIGIAGRELAKGGELEPIFAEIVRWFYVDGERLFPTTFSSAILLYSACLLAVIAYRKWRSSGPYTLHWWVLSIIFVYLAMDESASRIFHVKLHEEAFDFLIPAFGIHFIHFWVIPVSLLLLVFLLFFLRFLHDLAPRYRRLFIASGAVYVAGALGLEAAGGLYAEWDKKAGFVYQLLVHLEETCEMMGIVLYIYTLHSYLLSMSRHSATGTTETIATNNPSRRSLEAGEGYRPLP
jgi:hypothetical protein